MTIKVANIPLTFQSMTSRTCSSAPSTSSEKMSMCVMLYLSKRGLNCMHLICLMSFFSCAFINLFLWCSVIWSTIPPTAQLPMKFTSVGD